VTAADLAHRTLAEQLAADPHWGWTVLHDPAWRKAWDQVPRAAFVPDVWWTWDGTGYAAHDRDAEPDAWAAIVHSPDDPVITQVTGGRPTCSVSAPVLVAAMLAGLQVEDGMTVLESGTGSGWTSSLLSARLGDRNVVSVEYDRALAEGAKWRSRVAGFHPLIRAGDGEAGYPSGAPFDRVAATHAVARVPLAWIAQTRPGGLVCAPLFVARGFDAYVALTVRGDGSASGPILFPVAFMGSRTAPDTAGQSRTLADGPGREGRGSLDVPAVLAAKERWVLELALPGLRVTGPLLEDGDDTVWLATPDGSWAVAYVPQGAAWDGAVVEQHGPRDVWTVAEDAYASWIAAGRPTLDRYGLTVEADGTHRIWLDSPGDVVTTLPLPA
jgi:protein-L-isoaspartate O-methyltransferase